MAGVGQSIGLLGLAQGIDHRAQRRDEMLSLEKLSALSDAKQKQEVALQQYQAQEMDKIREQVDKLLAPNRAAINKKAKQMSTRIRQQVKMYGSAKEFYKNGGVNLIETYKSDILDSNEMGVFRANKENLTRLMQVQLQHPELITQRDLKAQQDFISTNGATPITYSGILNPIEMPDKAFMAGQPITTDDIIKYNQNKIRLIHNYSIEYPDEPLPTSEKELNKTLKAYAVSLGLTSIGTNTKMKAAYNAKIKKQQELENVKSFSGMISGVYNQLKGQSITLENVDNVIEQNVNFKTIAGNKQSNKTGKDNTIIGSVASWVTDRTSFGMATKVLGLRNISDMIGINRHYKLRGARVLNIPTNVGVKASIDPDVKLVNGAYTGDLLSGTTTYNAKGTEINKPLDGNWTPIETLFGFMGKSSKNGEKRNVLIMDKTDDNGKTKESVNYGVNNLHLQPVMIQSFKDEDGNVVYKEIPIKTLEDQTRFSNAMGKDDNVKSASIEQSKFNKKEQTYQAILKQQKIKEYKGIKSKLKETQSIVETFDETFTANDLFEKQAKLYQSSNGINNRDALIKAIYTTYADAFGDDVNNLINKNLIKTIIDEKGLKEKMLNYNISDEDIVDTYSTGLFHNLNAKYQAGDISDSEYKKSATNIDDLRYTIKAILEHQKK